VPSLIRRRGSANLSGASSAGGSCRFRPDRVFHRSGLDLQRSSAYQWACCLGKLSQSETDEKRRADVKSDDRGSMGERVHTG
jgi:hypothetical protein